MCAHTPPVRLHFKSEGTPMSASTPSIHVSILVAWRAGGPRRTETHNRLITNTGTQPLAWRSTNQHEGSGVYTTVQTVDRRYEQHRIDTIGSRTCLTSKLRETSSPCLLYALLCCDCHDTPCSTWTIRVVQAIEMHSCILNVRLAMEIAVDGALSLCTTHILCESTIPPCS